MEITSSDLRYALRDMLEGEGEVALDDLRDARRAATVLTPDDVKDAVLRALEDAQGTISERYR